VRLALDDFGTGFSSLSYIRRFSLDMLKIDKSFVEGLAHEPDDVAIVEHVIGMAKALGMVTVAEGVEHAEQLRQLQRLGCERAQGFWFSPPVPPELIGPMLTDPHLAPRWSDVRPAAPVTRSATADGEATTKVSPLVVGMLRDLSTDNDPSTLLLPPMPDQYQLELEEPARKEGSPTADGDSTPAAPTEFSTPASPPEFSAPVALTPALPAIALPPMFRPTPLEPAALRATPAHDSTVLEPALPVQFSSPKPVSARSIAPRQARLEESRSRIAASPHLAVPPSPMAAAKQTANSDLAEKPTMEQATHDHVARSTVPPAERPVPQRVAPPPPAPRGTAAPKRPARVPTSLPSLHEVRPDASTESLTGG